MKKQIFYFGFAVFAFALISCSNKPMDGYTDTPTTGKITIAVDETFQPVIEEELPVFHAIYQYAKITPLYVPEVDALNLLIKDSVRLAVVSRKLSEKEISYFNNKQFIPRQVEIAVDGIAVLLHPSNPDSLLTVDQIQKILIGEITDWSQIDPSSKLGKINVVFDNPNSSTVRYAVDSIAHSTKLGKHLSAMEYNLDVVEYVADSPSSIGLIGVSWISDRRDTTCLTFYREIRVARISDEETATIENSFQPYQAYLATGQYPFRRMIYMVLTEPRTGLASGFVSFVSSDKGQRIILKTGILPYTQTIRIVNVRDEM